MHYAFTLVNDRHDACTEKSCAHEIVERKNDIQFFNKTKSCARDYRKVKTIFDIKCRVREIIEKKKRSTKKSRAHEIIEQKKTIYEIKKSCARDNNKTHATVVRNKCLRWILFLR